MKTRFFLTLLTLTGLCSIVTSASADAASIPDSSHNIANLSQTIAKSIDLNGTDLRLVESAINRALLAKGDKDSKSIQPNLAGGIPAKPDRQPVVNGKVANPDRPIINGRIVNPNRPIINGVIAAPNQKK